MKTREQWGMRRLCRFAVVILILVSGIGCDQMTKHVARESLAASPPVSLLNDFVRFEYTENLGAFLGLGSDLPSEGRFLLLVIFASTSLLLALALMIRVRDLGLGTLIGVSLLASGGMGNLVDRIFNDGAVVDFVRLGTGRIRTGIFNLADVAIMAGAAMVLVSEGFPVGHGGKTSDESTGSCRESAQERQHTHPGFQDTGRRRGGRSDDGNPLAQENEDPGV